MKFLDNNQPTQTKKKKFNIPPIAIIIICGILIIVFLFILINKISSNKGKEDFKRSAVYTEAVIDAKTSYTAGDDNNYTIHYLTDLTVDTDKHNEGGEYSFRLDLTTPELEKLNPGETIGVYYNPDNPSECIPASDIPNYTVNYFVLIIIIVILGIITGINVDILMRNIHGYTPKYTRPEDIGTMGEAGAENSLSDSQIDYSANDTFSAGVMDSYSDPFATYSGYDEEKTDDPSPDGSYYDPNSFFTGDQQYAPVQDNINTNESDINNPFLSSVNTDPDNPYNQGNYSGTVPDNGNAPSENDPFAFYGDGSFPG